MTGFKGAPTVSWTEIMTKFKDLSVWLKIAVVWAYINLAASFIMLIFYALIGIFSLE